MRLFEDQAPDERFQADISVLGSLSREERDALVTFLRDATPLSPLSHEQRRRLASLLPGRTSADIDAAINAARFTLGQAALLGMSPSEFRDDLERLPVSPESKLAIRDVLERLFHRAEDALRAIRVRTAQLRPLPTLDAASIALDLRAVHRLPVTTDSKVADSPVIAVEPMAILTMTLSPYEGEPIQFVSIQLTSDGLTDLLTMLGTAKERLEQLKAASPEITALLNRQITIQRKRDSSPVHTETINDVIRPPTT
jgi:hypothetical protein